MDYYPLQLLQFTLKTKQITDNPKHALLVPTIQATKTSVLSETKQQ